MEKGERGDSPVAKEKRRERKRERDGQKERERDGRPTFKRERSEGVQEVFLVAAAGDKSVRTPRAV